MFYNVALVFAVQQSESAICIHAGLRKMVLMNLFTEEQWRHRHREQTYGHGGREEEGEGRMYGESSMETNITMCKTDS